MQGVSDQQCYHVMKKSRTYQSRGPLNGSQPCIISFDSGNIAGIPLCCQQRPKPRTRRVQGVPFLVRAPHMVTISFGSVGRSFDASDELEELPPSEEESMGLRGGFEDSFAASEGSGDTDGVSTRSTMSGGAGGLPARPAKKPPSTRISTAKGVRRACDLRNLLAQLPQKRRLVHSRHFLCSTRSPHSAQKFGLYITTLSDAVNMAVEGNSPGALVTKTAREDYTTSVVAEATVFSCRVVVIRALAI